MVKKELISSENLQMPEGKYTFGIPTRFDVKDPRYQEVVKLEELNERIEEFFWPTSTGFSNDIEGVSDYLENASRYKEAILEAEPYLSHLKKDNYSFETSSKKEILPEGVKEEKITLKWFQNNPGWKYTFNPWKLLTRELDSLEADLQTLQVAMMSRKSSIWQIRKLRSVVKAHDENGVKDFVSEASLQIEIKKDTHDFEDDTRTEAGRRNQINKQIAERSDMYVRFDGSYLDGKVDRGLHCFPFEYISDPKHQLSRDGLRTRTEVRDFIEKNLKAKGEIVINGVTIKEEKGRIVSDSPVLLWVINLFAQPILSGGKVLEPEEWAIKEREMVDDYRALTPTEARQIPHPSVAKILTSYNDFGTLSNKEKIADLRWCLKIEDYHL